MKIINEKGKLFGLINIVDLLVLIAAVAVAAGVGYKLFAPQIKESVQPQVELTALVSGNSYVNGTIEDMKIEDYAQQVTTADGRIVTAVDPDKKDIVFTIKTTVPKGTATPSIGTQEVRAGRTFIVKTNDFETSGNIDSVDIAE